MVRKLARFAQVVEPVELARLPRGELLRLAEAGEEVAEIQRVLAKTGDNVVGELLRLEPTFYEWDHYPTGDVHDAETGAQYYYHAHAAEERFADEHGHFHAFVRPKLRPRGQPAPGPGRDLLCHLVAISMNAEGVPFRLFTVNRWVTGETWYPAEEALALLDDFAVRLARPSYVTNRWIGACVRLFRPQIVALIQARDRVVGDWRRRYPGRDVLEDRQLEVTSTLQVSVAGQIRAIAAALEKPRSRPKR